VRNERSDRISKKKIRIAKKMWSSRDEVIIGTPCGTVFEIRKIETIQRGTSPLPEGRIQQERRIQSAAGKGHDIESVRGMKFKGRCAGS